MKVTGVTFLNDLVASMLRGDKDETRRIELRENVSPCGLIGDLIFVRENCRALDLGDGYQYIQYGADKSLKRIERGLDAWKEWEKLYSYRGGREMVVPSLHAPRWTSRLTLKIIDARREPIQMIDESGAEREGMRPNYTCVDPANRKYILERTARDNFMQLFNQIYGNWKENPTVWVYRFTVIHENVDVLLRKLVAEVL